MQIDAGVVITGLIALISLAAWVGALSQRVKGQDNRITTNRKEMDKDIEGQDNRIAANRKEVDKDIERLHIENREDHKLLFAKLEEMNQVLRNGRKSNGRQKKSG